MIEKLQAIWDLAHELDIELEKKLEGDGLTHVESKVLDVLHVIELQLENMGIIHP